MTTSATINFAIDAREIEKPKGNHWQRTDRKPKSADRGSARK